MTDDYDSYEMSSEEHYRSILETREALMKNLDKDRCSTPSQDTPAPSVEMQTAYRDHTITVDRRLFRFRVEGPALDGVQWHDSYRKATEDIDKAVAAHRKQNAVALALPVVDETGTHQTIRGIHAVTCDYLGLPTGRRYGRTPVYPQVTWITQLLRERATFRKEIAQIEKTIRPFQIEGGRGYGRIDAYKHDGAIAALKSDWKAKTDEAIKAAPPTEPVNDGTTPNTDTSPNNLTDTGSV